MNQSTITITAASHPALFEACETISHDAGTQAGWTSHTVPAGNVASIEAALAGLTADDLETLCIGDEDDMAAIASRSPDLKAAHRLLNEFFEHHLPRPSLTGPPAGEG